MNDRFRFAVCATCDNTITQRPHWSLDHRVELWNPPICVTCLAAVNAQTRQWLECRYGTTFEERDE